MKPARTVPFMLLLGAGLLMPGRVWATESGVGATATAVPARAVKHTKASTTARPEPGSVATAPAQAPVDPLEQLRQRLAERLAGSKTSEATGPYDLRLTTKPPVVAAAPVAMPRAVVHPNPQPLPKAAAPRSPSGGHGATGKAANSQTGPGPWSYEGAAGPQTWGGLKAEFALCGNGQRQSPIDIRGGLAVDLDPVRFDYQSSRFGVIDNGHTVQVNVAPGNSIELSGKRFELKQFHFHRPSEERIDGRQFDMSVHLVHQDEQGRLAVVAVVMDKGPAQPAVQKVWNNLPLEKHEETAPRITLDVNEILPADRRYYTYMGSLTTPPCSEGVQWVVMRQPVTMAADQIELFSRIYPMNARPVQQAAGRRIMQSN